MITSERMPVSRLAARRPASTASTMAVGLSPCACGGPASSAPRGSARSRRRVDGELVGGAVERVLGLEHRERDVERLEVVLERLADLAHVDGAGELSGVSAGSSTPCCVGELEDRVEPQRAVEVAVLGRAGRGWMGGLEGIYTPRAPACLPRGGVPARQGSRIGAWRSHVRRVKKRAPSSRPPSSRSPAGAARASLAPAPPGEEPPPPPVPGAPAARFGLARGGRRGEPPAPEPRLRGVDLTLAPEDLAALEANPYWDVMYPARVEIDGRAARGVARFRGASARTRPQKSWRIDLDPGYALKGAIASRSSPSTTTRRSSSSGSRSISTAPSASPSRMHGS